MCPPISPITSAYFFTQKSLWICEQVFRSESVSTLLKYCIECNVDWLNLARCTWRCKPQCRLALLCQNGLYSVCCLSSVRIILFFIRKKRASASFVSWFLFPENNETPPPPPESNEPQRLLIPKVTRVATIGTLRYLVN